LHIALLTASASRLGGGVATAVQGHAAMLTEARARVTVVALEDAYSDDDRGLLGATPLATAKVAGPGFFGYSPDLLPRLLDTGADILHQHGIWMYPSRAATLWARQTGKPHLISPHGMLDPWITARGRWKKALARQFYERASWNRANAFHALTADEAADIRREAEHPPVLIIPNAGPPALADPPRDRAPIVLYLGRIHPKKNLTALVDAWEVADLPQGAELLIAGWGAATDVAELETRLAAAPPSIRFLGSIHGEAKQRLLEQARFMVLPSHSEGLPMAILEAWAAGTPTVMSAACHLPEGFAAGAAIECGTDTSSIAQVLGQALARDRDDWNAMSGAASTLARGRFSAGQVAQDWIAAYRGLMAGKAA